MVFRFVQSLPGFVWVGFVLFMGGVGAELCPMTLLKIWEYQYNSDFAAGVKLLIDHDGKKLLTAQTFERLQRLSIFGGAVDAYNLGKLTVALRKITIKDSEPAGQVTEESKVDLDENFWTKRPALDPDLAAKFKEEYNLKPPETERARKLHKEQSHYHALLVAATTDKERGEHAGKILSIATELDAEYDRIRATETGAEPPSDMPPPLAPQSVDTLRRLNSLRTRISQLKRNLIPKAIGERLATLEKELEKKLAEAQRLENELA